MLFYYNNNIIKDENRRRDSVNYNNIWTYKAILQTKFSPLFDGESLLFTSAFPVNVFLLGKRFTLTSGNVCDNWHSIQEKGSEKYFS